MDHLSQIQNIFLRREDAIAGRKILEGYFESKDEHALSILLRDHRLQDKAIKGDEVVKRDKIDTFLEYFNVLSLAIISGVVKKDEVYTERDFIIRYLGHPSLKTYYEQTYPLLLPQVLYIGALNQSFFTANIAEDRSAQIFNSFLCFNQSLEDADVDFFLWLLDDGSWGREDINDINRILDDPQIIINLFRRNRNDKVTRLLYGYFKFVDFISGYHSFLNGLEKGSIIQSSYWHVYGYWFRNFKEKITYHVYTTTKGVKRAGKSSEADEKKMQMVIDKTNQAITELFSRGIYESAIYESLQAKWRDIKWAR